MTQYYAGLDVSMDQTNITTVNDKGKIVFENTTKTDPQSIDTALRTAGFNIQKMSIESGPWSHWLIKELSSMGWNITCIDARSISPLLAIKTNKTDRNDAQGIAEAVRTQSQYVREVHQRSEESIDLGTLLVTRRTFVSQRTAISNTVRGLLKTFGIHLGPLGQSTFLISLRTIISKHWPSNPKDIASKAYPAQAFDTLAKCFDNLLKEINTIDQSLVSLARKDKVIQRLMTVPGAGPLTAITYKVVIDDPKRFKKSRFVGAYLGMCPKQYSSGQIKRQGRISKRGSKELRTLLAGSGMILLTRCKKNSTLKTWGDKIAAKHGNKKAATALARKMSIIMHQIWSKNTVFEAEKI